MNRKKFVLGGALSICILAAFYFVSKEDFKPVAHNNLVDFGISQFGESHITTTAKSTNPEFKTLAFEPVKSGVGLPFQNQVATVIKSIKWLVNPKSEQEREYGTWIWTPPLQMTDDYMNTVISGAKAKGVNAIYLSIDSYLDIFVMPKSQARENKKTDFSKKLEQFISLAQKEGIAVDAEAGWRNWGEAGNEYKGLAVANFAKNFNLNSEQKFRGFQYDVEPYLLEEYKTDPATVLKNFVALIDKTQNFLAESDLKFSVVAPDFYDKEDKVTPAFSYDGKKDFAFGHILRVLDKRPGSSVILMSYRNFANGSDGSIEVSQNEMHTAKNYSTDVIIAQETGDVPPPYITFYGMSERHFSNQISIIGQKFEKDPNFGGIAIHYVNAFLALK